jgi:hypothetical protein
MESRDRQSAIATSTGFAHLIHDDDVKIRAAYYRTRAESTQNDSSNNLHLAGGTFAHDCWMRQSPAER